MMAFWRTAVLALMVGSVGCTCASSHRPSDAAGDALAIDAADYGVLPDLGTGSRFPEANAMSCEELNRAWLSELELAYTEEVRACDSSADCVEVSSSLDCEALALGELEVDACGGSVSLVAADEWERYRIALGLDLCAARTEACTPVARCLRPVVAECIDGLCTAR